MIMKRSSGEMENITSMAKCLMMLSRGGDSDGELIFNPSSKTAVLGRVFECKTCNRQFSSFQALGGHRASHKKPRLMEGDTQNQSQLQTISQAIKPKTHECSICGLEFAIGQALGGHMRRHRATLSGDNHHHQQVLSTSPATTSSSSSGHHQQVPVLKRSTSRRVLCLDLNLTPLENDLELPIGTGFPEKNTRPPMIHCFI